MLTPKFAIKIGVCAALLLIFSLPLVARAEAVRVELLVSDEEIRAGDEATLTVKATGPLDSVGAPVADGLRLQEAGTTTSMSIINNTLSSTLKVHYRVAPSNPGTYTIGPAVAYQDGRVVGRSNRITLKVLPGLRLEPVLPDAQDLSSYEGKGVFVLAYAPRNEFVVGEPFRFDLDLYIRRGVPVAGAEISRQPTFDGFKRVDLFEDKSQARRYKRSVLIGRTTYDVHPLDRSMLIALGAGERILGEAEIKTRISRGFRVQYKKVLAQPLRVRVVEPFAKGQPSSFVPGAVGNFELTGSLEPRTVKPGERILLELQVSGEGNLDALATPKITIPDGFRIEPIPGRDCPERQITPNGFKGRCIFQTVLFPERPGSFEAGPAHLAFFNPKTRSYEEATVGPWKIEVEGDAAAASNSIPHINGVDTTMAGDPILEPPFLDRLPGKSLVTQLPAPPPPWQAYGIPLLALFLMGQIAGFRRRLQGDEQRQTRRKIAAARSALRKLPTQDLQRVSEGIAVVMRDALLTYYQLDPRGLPLDGLGRALARVGVPEEVRQELMALLEAAEAARFSGSGDPKELKTRALDVLERL